MKKYIIPAIAAISAIAVFGLILLGRGRKAKKRREWGMKKMENEEH